MTDSDKEKRRLLSEDTRARISAVTDPFTEGTAHASAVLKAGAQALDRNASAQADLNYAAGLSIETGGMAQAAAGYGIIQECRRMMRDELICRQGHKRFMYGCLETLYKHRAFLENAEKKG